MRNILILLAALPAFAAESTLVDRVGSTGFVQLEAESFRTLSLREQTLAYWLTQASIAIDPINYDQNSAWGLRQKALLEEILRHPAGVAPETLRKLTDFTKLFWASRGNHNETTAQKILPVFTSSELRAAALAAQHSGAFAGKKPADVESELTALGPSLFDPDFEPTITAKSPRGKLDILQSSANNFYRGVSLADLGGFQERYPLNSRLVKTANGKLVEEVYRAGTPDGKVAPGLYARYLAKAVEFLEKARAMADPEQAKAIANLIRYYQTGEFSDWLDFGIAWVRNNPRVDFVNGFVEVYRDARAAKGTSQSIVSVTDEKMNQLMVKLAANAQYFEDRAPWAQQYKKQGVKAPMAKACETLIETGDFHVSTVGDNLPNENQIREKYGSKSFLLTGSSRTLRQATGHGVVEEFATSKEEIEIAGKYGEEASNLMTALHEIIGHGSGKLNPKLQGGSESHLKEYYSTLEEARADLVALWNISDPRLRELGLVSHPDVMKAMYYNAVRNAITQLARIPKGDTIEEDHQRDRQLIVHYIMDKTGGIRRIERDGKAYLELTDFARMREGAGMLLSELMRIKAEGDYAAIKALIDKYGVHFDTALRDQVVTRYAALNLPTYWCGINADLSATFDSSGKITAISISYPRDYVKQQLGYSSLYTVQ
jgi:dipeptidyl-peptidase III